MAKQQIQIDHVVDYSKSIKGAADFEKKLGTSHKKLDETVKKTTSAIGRAGPAMTGVFSAMTAGASAAEGAWASLGFSIVGAFGAGGLAGGAIALAGAGLGLLIRDSKKESEVLKDLEASTKGYRTEIEKLDQAIRAALGVDEFERKLNEIDKKIEEVLVRPRGRGKFNKFGKGFEHVPRSDADVAELKALREQRKALNELTEKRDRLANESAVFRLELLNAETELARKRLEIEKDIARESAQLLTQGVDNATVDAIHSKRMANLALYVKALKKAQEDAEKAPFRAVAESLFKQNEMLDARTPKERALVQLRFRLQEIEDKIAEARKKGFDRLADELEISKDLFEKRSKRLINSGKDGPNQFSALEGTFKSATVDGIIAGATEGSKAAGKIWESTLLSIGKQALGNIIGGLGDGGKDKGSGILGLIGGIIRSIPASHHGGVFNKPTLTLVAERGRPEEIRPVGQGDSGSGGRGGDIFINAQIDSDKMLDNATRRDTPAVRFLTVFREPRDHIERQMLRDQL